MSINNNNYCVIMCGGIGSRFWPLSRKSYPKQFLDFFGTGYSLLQQTFQRFNQIIPTENIFFVTNKSYANLIKAQIPGIDDSRILLEPMRRNTAPCIAWATYHIYAINPNANIVVTPSDHLIMNEGNFVQLIESALKFAGHTDNLLTLGIKPNRPETGYGYIQIDEEHSDIFYKVKTFTEKPELDLAKVFVESGEFYWNSGIFIWNVNSIMNALQKSIPDLTARLGTEEAMSVYGTDKEYSFIDENYPACPNISIDFGVMEKAENVYVLLGDFGWSDLGTWNSIYELSDKDDNENVIREGETMLYDCKDNIIAMPKDKLLVMQDMNGYLIADSNNVLLICKKEEEKSIRKFVTDAQLKLGDEYI